MHMGALDLFTRPSEAGKCEDEGALLANVTISAEIGDCRGLKVDHFTKAARTNPWWTQQLTFITPIKAYADA